MTKIVTNPQENPQVKKRSPYRRRKDAKVDLSEALKMRLVNRLSYKKIGEYYGVTEGAVYQSLKPLIDKFDDPEELKAYSDNNSAILKSVEKLLVNDLTDPDRRAKASLNNTAYALRQVVDIRRLSDGLSTANVSVRDAAFGLLDRLKELEEETDTMAQLCQNLDNTE